MRIATCIEHSDKDKAVINGKEYSDDLSEYSESRGNPNLTVISEYGLYRIFAKCNLPKCEPISNPLIPVTPLESFANRDHPSHVYQI